MGKQKSFFTKVIATGFGIGYSPIAPGTVASLLGLICLIIPLSKILWIAISSCLFLLGVIVGGEAEKLFSKKDPKQVVIDEIVGYILFLSLVPHIKWCIIIGFILYRLLDIIKPYPAFRLQQLPGGWGIMMDDIISGLYTTGIILCLKKFLIP